MSRVQIDCLGLRCPIPIIRAASALRIHEEILLISDDPATLPDLHAWSRMTGNTFRVMGTTEFLVTKITGSPAR
jgi:TusA-related sulfurtransferase